MKHFINRLRYAVLALVFAAGAFAVFVPSQTVLARDCDANAVMRCGAYSISELKQKYQQNQAGNTQAIFQHFGIKGGSAFDGMVNGHVSGDNKVYVGDRLVATNAVTAGRQNMSGSTAIVGGAAYMRPPSVSFANPRGSLDSFVKLDGDGNFLYAVIKSCGNPVKAQPVKQPKPQPKPQPEKPKEQPKPREKKPNYEIDKMVRKKGGTLWMEQVEAHSAGHVEFRIVFRNTGETDLQNVVVRDELPSGVNYIAGSLAFSVDTVTGADAFFGDGSVIPSMKAGDEVVATFSVEVTHETEGCRDYRNVAFMKPPKMDEKEDEARVRVCKPEVKTKVTPPPAPKEEAPEILPVTGVSTLLGLFSATSIAGGLAHHFVYRRLRK